MSPFGRSATSGVAAGAGTGRTGFTAGTLDALPAVGAMALGFFVYGTAALEQGLSPAEVIMMSVLTFAVPAQVVVVELFGEGASTIAIITAVALINLRFAVMSLSLYPKLSDIPARRTVPSLLMLSATPFSLASLRFESAGQTASWRSGYFFAICLILYLSAVVGTALSCVVAEGIPPALMKALYFLLPMFLISQLAAKPKRRDHLVAAAAAVVCPLVILHWGSNMAVLAALLISLSPHAVPRSKGGA